jgi:HlyD family secretion protein
MKKVLIATAAIVLITGIASVCFNMTNTGDVSDAKTYSAGLGNLIITVSATGVIEPWLSIEIKSKASGEILSFNFEPGDFVSKGQTIIELDRRMEKRNFAQKQADLAGAKAALDSAKAKLMEVNLNLKRTTKLYNQKLVSDQARDIAVAAEAMARAKIGEVRAIVAKAELSVDDAEERVSNTIVTSPIDGTLVEKSVQRGQIITSGMSSVTGGTKLCIVADLSRLVITAMVDETDIGRVKPGQVANVTVDAWPDSIFRGVVKHVHPVGESSENITAFKVEVEVSGDDAQKLRPNMTANVDIIIKSFNDVLLIPDESIFKDSKSGNNFVYLMIDGGPQKRTVEIGPTNGFDTTIVKGIKSGDMIFIKPPKIYDKGR